MASEDDRPLKLAILTDADNASPRALQGAVEEVASIGEASVRPIYGDFSAMRLKGWSDVLSTDAIVPHQNFANMRRLLKARAKAAPARYPVGHDLTRRRRPHARGERGATAPAEAVSRPCFGGSPTWSHEATLPQHKRPVPHRALRSTPHLSRVIMPGFTGTPASARC